MVLVERQTWAFYCRRPHPALLVVCVTTCYYLTSLMLLSPPAEIQDQDRGPPSAQTHGVPGRRRAGWHHEGQGQLLDDAGGVPGKRNAGAGEARSHCQIKHKHSHDPLLTHHVSPTADNMMCKGVVWHFRNHESLLVFGEGWYRRCWNQLA